MCTMMTFSSDRWRESHILEAQIRTDFKDNSDGSLLMLADSLGQIFYSMKTFDVGNIISTLHDENWHRCFIHNRFATQGSKTLSNIHGWQYGQVYWMHNGTLMAPAAARFEVDSQWIGHLIAERGIQDALGHIVDTEYFANVLVVDAESSSYYLSRSIGGTLYTDNLGNFSTNAVGLMRHPVLQGHSKYDIVTGLYSYYGFLDTTLSQLPPPLKTRISPEQRSVGQMSDAEYEEYIKELINMNHLEEIL